MGMRIKHVITPGDHFSPSTGSAIPTVVYGLTKGAPSGHEKPEVVVARGTYGDRYGSASIVEYQPTRPLRLPSRLEARKVDAALSVVGAPRVLARREWRAAVSDQANWAPSVVVGHNAVQLMPCIDTGRHAAVLHAHNELLRSYRRREVSRVLGRVSGIVCVSNFLAHRFADFLPPELVDRVRVVHNGIDFETFRSPEARTRGDVLEVVFLGRMIPDKGADVAVRAVARLGRRDIHFTVIGSQGFAPESTLTPFERELRELARGANVTFRPFIPRGMVVRALQAADVSLVPSRWPEPFALTVLEGMAAGTAVLASEIGGIPETVGETGGLVKAGDVDALAEALAALADDESLRERMVAAGLEVARRHDWSLVASHYYDTVAELIEPTRRSRL